MEVAAGDAMPPVSREDQQCINAFGRLHAKLLEVTEERSRAKAVLESITDASAEIFEVDESDDTALRYHVGDVFVQTTFDDVQQLLERDETREKERVAALDARVAELEEALAALKARLKAKFGNAIHLEA